MADKKIYMQDSPVNPHLQTSPFDWTYTTNLTGRFGKVNCAMMKYLPPHTKLKIKPYFAFDMQPLVFPVQTNVRCHLKFYKVPLRILWKDFEDFAAQLGTNGLPTNGGGTPFVMPYIKRPTGWNEVGSLAEQIGCCNQALVGKAEQRSVHASFFKASTSSNILFGTTFNSSFGDSIIFATLPNSCLLEPSTYGSLSGFTLGLSYVDTSNSGPSGSSGTRGFFVQAIVRGHRSQTINNIGGHREDVEIERDEYRVVASTSIDSFVTSASNFSAATSSVSFTMASAVTSVDGHSMYNHKVYCKIVDDSFFAAVNQALAQDMEVTLAITPTGAFAPLFFPNEFSAPTIHSLQDAYNQIKVEDNNTVYQDVLVDVGSSLGATGSVLLSLTTVRSEVDTKFDSINSADPQVPVSALPFRALEFIHNYFMRNPRIDPFIKDGVPTYNRFLTNDGSGADSTTPVESWNALYETDYFTSCVKEPQFGNAPLVGATVNDTSDTGILTFSDGTGYNDYTVKVNADANGNVAPLTLYGSDADHPNLHRLQEMIDFGISINDLRNVSTFQRMLERMQRTEYRFANVVYEFFGTNPPVGDHYPQYLGGVTRNVTVDKITNVAESDDHPLGKFAGQGKFRGEGESISVFTTEPSYVVAIQYFTVTPTYSQFFPKHLIYKDPLDFYLNPEFAFMGPQPVYKGEVAPNQLTYDHFYDVFGYNRPYAELFGNVDEVHGLYKTDMANFLLQRFFGDAPELNKSFIEINSSDLTNIFSVVENTDKMFGQILFKMSAQLPAPRSYLPRSI